MRHQKIIAVNEKRAPKRNYPPYVTYELEQEELESYNKVALYVNESGADIFCVQHEFGLFGGFDGVFILKLLEKIKIPIITFLHTIPILKSSKRRKYRLGILKKICKFSKYIIVTANIGKKLLIDECNISLKKIVTIRHGGPFIPYPSKRERAQVKRKLNLRRKFIILSYGLLSKNKGYHIGIEAVSKLIKKYPNITYLILGEPHPIGKRKDQNISKRLRRKVKDLRVKNNVLFIDEYLDEGKLIDYLKMADIYLMPYLTKEQVSSGTLAYAMTTGSCIVSTPFIYAKELLDRNRGFFIDFESSNSIVKIVSDLIKHPREIERTRKKTYEFATRFTWPEIGKQFIEVFQKAKKLNIK